MDERTLLDQGTLILAAVTQDRKVPDGEFNGQSFRSRAAGS
jgi:hypothetical protein